MAAHPSQPDSAIDPTPDPGFFVVGTGRCGTTLVRKLLREHPDVHIPKETHWIPILDDLFGEREIEPDAFFRALRSVYMAKGKTAWFRILKEEGLTPEEFEAELGPVLAELPRRDVPGLTTAVYRALAARHGASRWGDKTPDYGLCMGRLQRLWPGARFLHVARDGRDVALSMSRVLSFRLQVAWGTWYWPALAWERAYESRLDRAEGELPLDAFFDLWEQRLVRIRAEAARLTPGCWHELDYDDLLRDPDATLRQVGSFLGLGDADAWLERARGLLRLDNRGRNRDRPGYRDLGARHAERLRALGFAA